MDNNTDLPGMALSGNHNKDDLIQYGFTADVGNVFIRKGSTKMINKVSFHRVNKR